MISTPNGSVQVRCAPSVELYQAGSHADDVEHQADAEARSAPTARSGWRPSDVEQHGGAEEAAAERQARASSEITGQTPITMQRQDQRAASASRAKSPTICLRNRLANQCSEAPRIGKVRPPPAPGTTGSRWDRRPVQEQHEQREEPVSSQCAKPYMPARPSEVAVHPRLEAVDAEECHQQESATRRADGRPRCARPQSSSSMRLTAPCGCRPRAGSPRPSSAPPPAAPPRWPPRPGTAAG